MNRISASSTSISHPIPVSQLNEAVHGADDACSSLHEVIDRLEARLESFLTPQDQKKKRTVSVLFCRRARRLCRS